MNKKHFIPKKSYLLPFCSFTHRLRHLLSGVLLLLSCVVHSQSLEFGLLAGGANYQGDLASSELQVMTKQIHFAFGGFLVYGFNDRLAVKLQVLQSELSADDAHSSFDALQQRNLRFFSPLLDGSLRFQWHFMGNNDERGSLLNPYLTLGGSVFTFNPQATYNGQDYELQPLNTEGQGLESYPDRQPYDLFSYSVLAGLGLQFSPHPDFNVYLEFASHYTFTDYLDDVSTTYANYQELALANGTIAADIAYQVDDFFGVEQTAPLPGTVRGNPDINDLFNTLTIGVSYRIISSDRSGAKGIGCPTF